jgi:biopolymer transport protein ExbB
MMTLYCHFMDLMTRGGYVMWPLLLLSLVSLTLAFERSWFWLRTNWPGRSQWIAQVSRLLRQGDAAGARALATADPSIYGHILTGLLAEPYSDALATDAVQAVRGRIDRFMPTLSTIITAAPMLGILGTVTGIISSFQVLSTHAVAGGDPAAVSSGIAEALLTTVAGLVVALFTLFFFSAFSAQVDRTLGRFETLIAGAARASGQTANQAPDHDKHPGKAEADSGNVG